MKKYKWFEIGDINGFFGMIADSMAILAIIAAILIYGFGFPSDVVFLRMIPGSTIGIFFKPGSDLRKLLTDIWLL